ncbi:Dph6-related ATP pyrophosphatase [Hymenobacter cheonanensis]|uniref:Dph6-related ATP pyrophosphatase n=1 Tax=Hymenobacter sp. CA2-7 TaxID=3063993 RepID=UPI00271330E2|nr:diphthine--ammonia ligase [Hymenobacter sp. CA2-7]MDO7887372.1 diphthine--ammonia ligase [Hymenobacter sp. CA2-7]
MPEQALMSWSGGKDSALALYHALHEPGYRVAHLLTSVNAHYERISMHGVRVALLETQAARLGLPLMQLRLPEMPTMPEYDQALLASLAALRAEGVATAVYGDIFLEDLRAYREAQLMRAGLRGEFPLWQRASADLLREFWALGFQAIVVCVNDRYLDASFCGRLLDEAFVRDLPPGVDPCGENGEYHSFVFDAPYFSAPIAFRKGELVRRTYAPPAGSAASPAPGADDPFAAGFWYCDLLPA